MSDGTPAQRGDEHELFERYGVELRRRVAMSVTTSAANVDDACAYAWMTFLRRQPEREYALPWLTVTARRYARNLQWRDRSRESTVQPDGQDYDLADYRDLTAAREAVIAAREELASLPESARGAVGLRGLGYTEREAAHALGVSGTRVEQLRQRGLIVARNNRRVAADLDVDAPPRLKVLAQIERDPPAWIRASIGRCPSTRGKGGEQARLRWCAMVMRLVDHRTERGISDPSRALGAEPDPEMQRAVEAFGASRRAGRDRGVSR